MTSKCYIHSFSERFKGTGLISDYLQQIYKYLIMMGLVLKELYPFLKTRRRMKLSQLTSFKISVDIYPNMYLIQITALISYTFLKCDENP